MLLLLITLVGAGGIYGGILLIDVNVILSNSRSSLIIGGGLYTYFWVNISLILIFSLFFSISFSRSIAGFGLYGLTWSDDVNANVSDSINDLLLPHFLLILNWVILPKKIYEICTYIYIVLLWY